MSGISGFFRNPDSVQSLAAGLLAALMLGGAVLFGVAFIVSRMQFQRRDKGEGGDAGNEEEIGLRGSDDINAGEEEEGAHTAARTPAPPRTAFQELKELTYSPAFPLYREFGNLEYNAQLKRKSYSPRRARTPTRNRSRTPRRNSTQQRAKSPGKPPALGRADSTMGLLRTPEIVRSRRIASKQHND